MSNEQPSFGDVPTGATMRPQYMGRIMTTYPISEPELENISNLNTQVTVRFSAASFLFALAAGVLTNAIFSTELTPVAQLATVFVAPLLLFFSAAFAIGGLLARRTRKSLWLRIKSDASPIPTLAQAGGLMISGSGQSHS